MKKLLGILIIGLCGITCNRPVTKEINQVIGWYDRRDKLNGAF